jgi:hypothetical protein
MLHHSNTKEEFEDLKSQFTTSSWGVRRKLPYAFTEHGVLMLSSTSSKWGFTTRHPVSYILIRPHDRWIGIVAP